MVGLRSRNDVKDPEKSQKISSVPQIGPATPSQIPEILVSFNSSVSSPSMAAISPVSGKESEVLGFGLDSSTGSGRRRSLRLASRSNGIDQESGEAEVEIKGKLSREPLISGGVLELTAAGDNRKVRTEGSSHEKCNSTSPLMAAVSPVSNKKTEVLGFGVGSSIGSGKRRSLRLASRSNEIDQGGEDAEVEIKGKLSQEHVIAGGVREFLAARDAGKLRTEDSSGEKRSSDSSSMAAISHVSDKETGVLGFGVGLSTGSGRRRSFRLALRSNETDQGSRDAEVEIKEKHSQEPVISAGVQEFSPAGDAGKVRTEATSSEKCSLDSDRGGLKPGTEQVSDTKGKNKRRIVRVSDSSILESPEKKVFRGPVSDSREISDGKDIDEARAKKKKLDIEEHFSDEMDCGMEHLDIDRVGERFRCINNCNVKRDLSADLAFCGDDCVTNLVEKKLGSDEIAGGFVGLSSGARIVQRSERIDSMSSSGNENPVLAKVEEVEMNPGTLRWSRDNNAMRRRSQKTRGRILNVHAWKRMRPSNSESSSDSENDRSEFGVDLAAERMPVKQNVNSELAYAQHHYLRQATSDLQYRRERFKEIAKSLASEYAHFNFEEGQSSSAVPESSTQRMPNAEGGTEPEDWPGPFSTARQLIKKRGAELEARRARKLASGESVPIIEWVPSRNHSNFQSWRQPPSLQDLSLSVLCRHSEEIKSLEGIPDTLRNKIGQVLYESSKMSFHAMELLVSGSPTEIRIIGCTLLSEEEFINFFARCDTSNLEVLQLDLCGRSMSDIFLLTTLACSSDSLPKLTSISLRGSYRLSDIGLNKLHSSAPALRAIDLSDCSLLTSDGINTLAESLGWKLRCLCIDNCQNVDAMMILPSLKKLENLEMLSVAGLQTVSDEFVAEVVSVCGPNMKKLGFAGCGKLTDSSMNFVGEKCGGLHALDLSNLVKLTGSSIGHLANGCGSIQSLKLSRCSLSDEAIATFLEASGGFLIELSLNGVKEVAHQTAIALASRCAVNLWKLDLSFCRNLTDPMLGLIVDKCLSLKELKLFGCSQVTQVFLEGHSNPHVKVLGMPAGGLFQGLSLANSA